MLRILVLVRPSGVRMLCSPVAHRATGDSLPRGTRPGFSSCSALMLLVRAWGGVACEFNAA